MHIGIALPISTPALGPDTLADAGQAAEQLGFHSLWTTELFTGAGEIDPARGRTVAQFIERLQGLSQLLT